MSERLIRRRYLARLWWSSLRGVTTDAILYALAAVFALGIGLTSTANAQWHWGYLAAIPYAVAALASLAALKVAPRHETKLRVMLVGLVITTAVVAPLVMEVRWRTEQPEVTVIQRGATDIAASGTPYQSYWRDGRLVHPVPHEPAYESFFPYFPTITIFGAPAAEVKPSSPLSDARIWMTLMTIVTSAFALRWLRATRSQKIRVAQFLVALPTGALFLATGGDDMPILALMLLGVVALQRRANNVAGVSLGLAAAMKLTAWPVALGALLVARDREERSAWRRVALWVAAIVGVTVVPFALSKPFAFFSNVVAFPLGLAHVASPAASPLPGHLLTDLWAPAGHLLTPLVLLTGGYLAAAYAKRHWPLTLAQLLGILAVFSTALICAASATRVGYLIYPLNFALWSRVCAPAPVAAREFAAVA